MSSKKTSYSAKSDADEMDSLGERLAADLRKNIRHLDNYPILSDPWFEMADIFGRVANISDVESKLPSAKESATLWETEEQALRFILEDGKLNLCLRLLIEFKSKQIETRRNGRGPILDFNKECDKFEKGVGVVMRNAWQHVEVLQTTDIPTLIHHIGDVLEATLVMPEIIEPLLKQHDIHQRQEVLVFYYLHGLIKHIGDISELRIMPLIRERKIFTKAINVLLMFGTSILTAHRFKACDALSLIAQSEDFVTTPTQYYDTSNSKEMNLLLDFREQIIAPLMTDFESRKALRPLADVIDRLKRQLSRK